MVALPNEGELHRTKGLGKAAKDTVSLFGILYCHCPTCCLQENNEIAL